MKRNVTILLIASLLVLLVLSLSHVVALGAPPNIPNDVLFMAPPGPNSPRYAPDQVMVRFKPGVTETEVGEFALFYNLTITEKIDQLSSSAELLYLFSFTPSRTVMWMVLRLYGDERVLSVEPNGYIYANPEGSSPGLPVPIPRDQRYALDHILVRFKPGIDSQSANVKVKQFGATVGEFVPNGIGGFYVVNTNPAVPVEDLVKMFGGDVSVENAELDYVVRASVVPNDTYYNSQWALPMIQAPAAWDVTTGSSATIVAVVDTGIRYDNEDLASGKVILGPNYVSNNQDPYDDNGHGTHVAGIASADTNNSLGVAGLSWNSKILAVKVLDQTGGGSNLNLVKGINYAVSNGAKVINLSLGTYYYAPELEIAVNNAWSAGAVVVASAGNDGSSHVQYPARFTNSISVGATNSIDSWVSFSNFGKIDVVAPGTGILSTVGTGFYTGWNNNNMQAWGNPSGDEPLAGDFTGDRSVDIGIHRSGSYPNWFVDKSTGYDFTGTGGWSDSWGNPTGDTPLVGDFNGDDKTDIGIYRPADATWYAKLSTGSGFSTVWNVGSWGNAGQDKPLVGDFNGDGKSDIGIHRTTSYPNWHVNKSTGTGFSGIGFSTSWGNLTGDTALVGHFSGQTPDDIGIHRGTDWYVNRSTGSGFAGHGSVTSWGNAGDQPLVGDFDGANGWNYSDTAIARTTPSGLQWSVDRSQVTHMYYEGTSMATPYVSGLAALLFAQHPTWTNQQVRNQIQTTADDRGDPGYDIYYGWGRINAARAVGAIP